MANRLTNSKYDIYNKLLGVAKKYTDVDNTDFLKAGLFGYVTESMAMISRDSSFHKTMLYNENFLNTAVMPRSVYNWAKMFNINIQSASPSRAEVAISIPTDSLEAAMRQYNAIEAEKYGADVSSYSTRKFFIIDRDTPFIAGDYKFLLERSIIIYKSGSMYVIRYCATEEERTSFQDLTTYELTYKVDLIDGVETVGFGATIFQFEAVSSKKIISSSSFLDTKLHKFKFTNQFVGAKLYYTKGSVTEPIELVYSNIRRSELNNTKFAYYSLTDTNEIQISFSNNLGDFIPSTNSILDLQIMTTQGTAGNITYTGNIILRLKDENLRDIPALVYMSSERAYGAVDTPSINSIKNAIIEGISTRDVIVTEDDLNNYFNILTRLLDSVSDGKVKFVKKRDDILRRVFTANIMLREGSETSNISKPIPTYTLDATFTPNAAMSYDIGTKIIRTPNTSEDYNSATSTTGDDYYIIPFYTKVSISPFRKVKYIYNLTDDSSSLSYYDIKLNNPNRYIFPKTVSIRRDMSDAAGGNIGIDKGYNLTFNFETNFIMSENDFNNIKLSFFRKGNLTTEIQNVTLTKADISHINIDNIETSSDGDNKVYNVSLRITLNTADEEFDFTTNIESDYGTLIKLAVGSNNTEVRLPEEVEIVADLNLTNMRMSFKSDKALALFSNMDSIMSSTIQINKDGNNKITSLKIFDIPVVHASFFKQSYNRDRFTSQMFTYIKLLKENLGKLETNTFFDLKFFNVKGLSRTYDTINVDIKLELNIHLNSEGNIDLANQIKEYTRTLVDVSNDVGGLRVSSIISNLTKQYPYIDHIEFKGLNGTFSQYIKTISNNQSDIPEHFNIPAENMQFIKVFGANGAEITS